MTILHGDNLILSRKRLDEMLSSFGGEVVRFSGNQLQLTELTQALESQSLFGTERLVVIENLFSRRPSKEKELILNYLKAGSFENLIIWEEKKIDGRTLGNFSKQKIQRFDLTSLIFKLMDSLAPGNQKISLNLLFECLKQDSPEMVFYMLVRQSRSLLIAKDEGGAGLNRMASWQQNKILSQSKKFNLEQLLRFHHRLLKIDYQQKTGQSPLPLSSQLDLLITAY